MIMQWTRAAYYLVGFDRQFPGKDRLAAAVQKWERKQNKGDSPKPQEEWDAQYSAGDWSYMGQFDEAGRYAIIVGYLAAMASNGSILDVGCGDGVLFQRLRRSGYGRYVGIDLSAAAIAARAGDQDAITTFEQADAEIYQPAEKFDVIVFNETLYYFHEPLATLRRYLQTGPSIAIISLYTASRRSRVVAAQIRKHTRVISETKTQQDGKGWVCLVVDRID